MKSFIQHLADIINNQPFSGSELCIVFPNRRAGLFLRRSLVAPEGKPIWAPDIISIEDFTFMISGLAEPDNITLLANLYKVHCQVAENEVSFDNFLSWGTEILRDFEEIDQYMIDSSSLFSYLKEAKQIDVWQPGEELTNLQKNYLAFYESLSDHYYRLKELLLEKKLAYQGLAGREIAENKENYLRNLPWKKIIFAGFNALSTSQIEILKYLVENNKAEIIWDTDQYYMDDPRQEAGFFLRDYKLNKELGGFNQIHGDFLNPDRNIFTCGIPGKIGQARIAGSIVNSLPLDKHQNTAIVLADESMLLPVLNSLPDHLDKFNVTMGFPLIQAPLYSLIDGIFQLHLNALNGNTTLPSFYHQDIISIFQNNYLHKLIDPSIAATLVEKVKKRNYSFINFPEMEALVAPDDLSSISMLFEKVTGTVDMLTKVAKAIYNLKDSMAEDERSSADNEILYSLHQKIDELIKCLTSENIVIESLNTLYNFFREIAMGTRVPFYGEPLQGIQVMGMLETRVLDFENVILISANEDILPSAKSNKSFIPFDVRRSFGLPTHVERQAVFSYHFYRLLQRNVNTWLIYNDSGNTLGGGEKSRFIKQIEWELPSRGIKIKPVKVTSTKDVENTPMNIEIKKTPKILKKLEDKAKSGFSFSALKLYINCPLSFYFSYVLNIKEAEEVEDTISVRTMGTLIHAVLEDLYSEFINAIPDINKLDHAATNAEALLLQKIKEKLPALKMDSGKNLLFLKVGETWLRRYLKDEICDIKNGNSPLIIGLETELSRLLSVTIDDTTEIKVKLDGKIDRIDSKDGAIRLIDYKTGSVKNTDLIVKTLESIFEPENGFEKKLQLSLYRYIAQADERFSTSQIDPGIISFKDLKSGFQVLNTPITDDEFEDSLKELIIKIFHPDIDFTQGDIENCKYCNYAQICHRHVKNSW